MKIQLSRGRERGREIERARFTAERGNKTPTKTKLVYLKYTHTHTYTIVSTLISEDSAYPTLKIDNRIMR